MVRDGPALPWEETSRKQNEAQQPSTGSARLNARPGRDASGPEVIFDRLGEPYMVKKFMQHACNTSISCRGACGRVLGFWAFAGQPALGGFFRRENDR